ncbi:MAG: putative DNA-binding domain-containing protein [Planctomycetota bacterium]|nr:putative DNA-binding domain-containing protein [Planctomycetota bacterium]
MSKARAQAGFDLATTQRWVHSVITHPGGIHEGLASDESRALVNVGNEDLEKAILPSKNLSAHERIEIYSNMIVWRLIECLAGDYSTVQHAVGEDAWDALARAYIAAHPSEHYSLNCFGAHFPSFLRDEAPELKNRHVLAELADLEWALQEVFDAPRMEPLSRVQLMAFPQDLWPEMRMKFVPAFRLFAFKYPVNAYLQAVREERKVRIPRLRASYVFVRRENFRVYREDLDLPRYTILSTLRQGGSVGDAIEAAAGLPGVKFETLGKKVGGWFQDWAGMGLFESVETRGA